MIFSCKLGIHRFKMKKKKKEEENQSLLLNYSAL